MEDFSSLPFMTDRDLTEMWYFGYTGKLTLDQYIADYKKHMRPRGRNPQRGAKRKAPARKVALPVGKKIPASWVKVDKAGKITAGINLPKNVTNPTWRKTKKESKKDIAEGRQGAEWLYKYEKSTHDVKKKAKRRLKAVRRNPNGKHYAVFTESGTNVANFKNVRYAERKVRLLRKRK